MINVVEYGILVPAELPERRLVPHLGGAEIIPAEYAELPVRQKYFLGDHKLLVFFHMKEPADRFIPGDFFDVSQLDRRLITAVPDHLRKFHAGVKVNLDVQGIYVDKGASPLPAENEPFRCQVVERLADRNAADADDLGKTFLSGKLVVFLQIHGADIFLNLKPGPVGQGKRV